MTLNTTDKCSVIISLLQTEQTRKRRETNGTYESSFEAMLFSVFSVKRPKKNSDKSKYSDRELTPLESITSGSSNSPTYEFARDFTRRYELTPGQYIVMPSLFEKDSQMKYLLRLFVESTNFSLTELGNQTNNDQEINQSQVNEISNLNVIFNCKLKIFLKEYPSSHFNDEAVSDQITENETIPNEEETQVNYDETTWQESYRSRVFEVPRFYQDQLSANVSRACSLM